MHFSSGGFVGFLFVCLWFGGFFWFLPVDWKGPEISRTERG